MVCVERLLYKVLIVFRVVFVEFKYIGFIVVFVVGIFCFRVYVIFYFFLRKFLRFGRSRVDGLGLVFLGERLLGFF